MTRSFLGLSVVLLVLLAMGVVTHSGTEQAARLERIADRLEEVVTVPLETETSIREMRLAERWSFGSAANVRERRIEALARIEAVLGASQRRRAETLNEHVAAR